jgi:hypothetical protein
LLKFLIQGFKDGCVIPASLKDRSKLGVIKAGQIPNFHLRHFACPPPRTSRLNDRNR